jgi:Fur family transcriptional regulator, stress-responsive regulator
VLAACAAAGLVHRIEPAGHPARFGRRTGDNHHHVVCRSCGRTEDVDCAVNVRPCLTPSDDHGYVLDEAEVVFWGSCPSCQAPAQDYPQDNPQDNQ